MPFFEISSVTGQGIEELKRAMAKIVLTPVDENTTDDDTNDWLFGAASGPNET